MFLWSRVNTPARPSIENNLGLPKKLMDLIYRITYHDHISTQTVLTTDLCFYEKQLRGLGCSDGVTTGGVNTQKVCQAM